MLTEKKGATILIGGQFGDEGKGLISAYFSLKNKVGLVARAGTGPGAEHGVFLTPEGPYLKTNQLPLGWLFNPDTQICIGSGVAVNPDLLFKEMETYGLQERVKVDYRCPIITPEHIQAERASKNMMAIGSTMSGTGACRVDFTKRIAKQAKDIPRLRPYLADVSTQVNDMAARGEVSVESSQGTFLSLALSPFYPDVTSDNVTAMAAADDVGLNWRRLKDVVLIIKSKPTREGSGPLGTEEMSLEDMIREDAVEKSSIGGVPRRKGKGINYQDLKYAAEINGATQVALTFVEQIDRRINNATRVSQITDPVWMLIERVQEAAGVPVTVLNTGKRYSSIIDLTGEADIDWQKVHHDLQRYPSVNL